MDQSHLWRLGAAFLSLVFVLLSTGSALAQQIPEIPHPVAGQEDCLGCHQGGASGLSPLSRDHSRQTNDGCQDCHAPAPIPVEQLPTPIVVFPAPAGANGCRDCHAELEGDHAGIINQWEISVHARSDVSCVNCHGGNPLATTSEKAKLEANYIGVPDRAKIPALCAGCHADTGLMRQYRLPADQYSGYQQSIHGYLFRNGDPNVPVCSDCHLSHQTLPADDPASNIHPLAVSEMCASCHSNEDVMAGYDTPTDQYELFRESVHGRALLDDRNLGAPSCVTCHGAHAPGPPGSEKAADGCGSCHSGAEDFFLQSPHAGAGGGEPDCVACHGRYDIQQASEVLFQGAAPGHCGACHPPESQAASVAQTLYQELAAASSIYNEAEAAVQAAREVGLPVETLEERLHEAETSLTAAREAQHTLDLAIVRQQTDKAQATGAEVKNAAETAVSDRSNLYKAAAIILVVVALAVVALVRLKRALGPPARADEN